MLFTQLQWTLSLAAVLSLIATVNASIPGGQSETEHSNYGDTGKAKEFAKEMGDKGKHLSEKEELLMLFSLHDSNKDGDLDGIELRAAFADFNQDLPDAALSLQQIVNMVDHVIAEDDIDNNGKISWGEYLVSQKYHEG